MEKEYFKGQWNQLKGNVKKTYGKITDDELLKSEGDYDKVVGLIQEKYGMAVSEVKEKVNDLIKNFKSTSGDKNVIKK